jgi:hypothetical protein
MKTYKVHWQDHDRMIKIQATTPEEAYKKFLESEEESKGIPVKVYWGLGGVQVFRDHMGKAEDVQETGSGGASDEKAQQARHEISTRTQDSLDEHKHSLRRTTAYSGLRMYLNVTAWLTAIGCVILGFVLIGENTKGIGVSLLLFGPLAAALQYFIASVYFDIADAGLNTSMRIQDLHRMESSKETVSKSERS